LRAVAVGGVMVFHYGLLPFAFAKLGVSLFFVLSGFLITLLMMRERETTGSVSLKRFYARRALRIFPAYYVFLVVVLAWMASQGEPTPPALVLASVFYVLNYVQAFGAFRSTPVSHGWSLGVEEQFYLVWPAMLRGAWRRRIPVPKLILVAVILVCAWRTTLTLAGVRPGYLYFAFDTRFDSLLIGCGLAICIRDGWVQRAARMVSANALLPVVTLLLLGASEVVPVELWFLTVADSFEAILLAILLVQGLLLHQHPLWRWLNWPIVRYLGTISYPLYLYHQLSPAIIPDTLPLRWSMQVALTFLVAIALAMCSYHLVERPFLLLKERFSPRSTGEKAVPTAA
jgi:peptidoglycan/LPS O-acetylase OafA/YrhL